MACPIGLSRPDLNSGRSIPEELRPLDSLSGKLGCDVISSLIKGWAMGAAA